MDPPKRARCRPIYHSPAGPYPAPRRRSSSKRPRHTPNSHSLAQFTEEEALTTCNFRGSLAEFLFLLGETDRAVAHLEETIARYPAQPAGYLGLGDAYGHLFGSVGPPRDLERAGRYDREGAEACPEHRAQFEERLEELR